MCFDPWSAKQIRGFLATTGRDARVVDVGSSIRFLDPRIIRFDIDHGAGVTVVGDGHFMPFASGSIDAVILTGVLEHVADPPTLVAEAYRALRSGGRVYAEVPFLQGYHAPNGSGGRVCRLMADLLDQVPRLVFDAQTERARARQRLPLHP